MDKQEPRLDIGFHIGTVHFDTNLLFPHHYFTSSTPLKSAVERPHRQHANQIALILFRSTEIRRRRRFLSG